MKTRPKSASGSFGVKPYRIVGKRSFAWLDSRQNVDKWLKIAVVSFEGNNRIDGVHCCFWLCCISILNLRSGW